jgi:cytochrome d ubiquinol oxidase subunit II
MEYLAASLVIVSLFIYAVLFSIECGATIFIAVPGLLGGDEAVHRYINPAWETTNVFLVTALISLIAFFPGAVPVWGVALIVPFFFFLLVMGVRVIGMLYVFYKEGENRAMKWLLAAASVAAPAVLAGGLLPFFVAGTMPYGAGAWLLAAGFALFTLASTIFISSSFFRPMERFARAALMFFLTAAMFLIATLFRAAPHLATGVASALPALAALAILDLALFFTAWGRRQRMRFFSAVALFAAFFFAVMFSQLPYVIYPSVTIFSAFTDPASAQIILGAFGIAAIFLVPALGLLYYLFAFKK